MLTTQRFIFRVHRKTSTPALQKSRKISDLLLLGAANKLLINPDKTKLILFGTKQLLSKVLHIRVPFLGQQLIPVSSVKDLGIILDSNLTFNEHVNTLTSSLISILCQIGRVRHLFSKSVLTTILNCLVFFVNFFIARQSGLERLRTT